MKKFLIIALLPAFIAGCGGNSTSAGRVKEKTFAQQYAELQRNPPDADYDTRAFQTADERAADVALAAQAERRAQPPLVESDYIFQVIPHKNVYSYDEYNRVWTDEPKAKDYKEEKRLWTKPKRHKGDYEPPAPAPAALSALAAAASAVSGAPQGYPGMDDEDW